MDFVDASVYERFFDEAASGKVTIPQGSTVYRGDGALGVAKAPSPDVPAFFGDKKVAEMYSRKNPQTITSYATTKPITLFVMTGDSIPEILRENRDDPRTKDLLTKNWLRKFKDSYGIAPATFMGKWGDEPHQVTAGNRVFAELLCSKEYDGWIVLPGTLAEFRANIVDRKWDGNWRVQIHAPEIMLCKWSDKMSIKEGVPGGRRKPVITRHRRTRGRKLNRLRSRRGL